MTVFVAPGGVKNQKLRSCVQSANNEHGVTLRPKGESIGGAVSQKKCMRNSNEKKATNTRAVPNTAADTDSPIRLAHPLISVQSP